MEKVAVQRRKQYMISEDIFMDLKENDHAQGSFLLP